MGRKDSEQNAESVDTPTDRDAAAVIAEQEGADEELGDVTHSEVVEFTEASGTFDEVVVEDEESEVFEEVWNDGEEPDEEIIDEEDEDIEDEEVIDEDDPTVEEYEDDEEIMDLESGQAHSDSMSLLQKSPHSQLDESPGYGRKIAPEFLSQQAADVDSAHKGVAFFLPSEEDTSQGATGDDYMEIVDLEEGSRDDDNDGRDDERDVAMGDAFDGGAKKSPTRKAGKKKKDFCFMLVICLLLLFIVAVVIGVVFGLRQGGENGDEPSSAPSPSAPTPSTPVPTSAPTTSSVKDFIYNLICNAGLPDCSVLLDSATPQGKSFTWLIEDNPNLLAYPESQVISRYVLATLYYAMNGENWTVQTGWLTDSPECEWYSSFGTSCTADGVFTGLGLDNNKVKGTFPYDINLLTSLTALSIANPSATSDSIGGRFPDLSSLGRLTSVSLMNNQITGVIPASFVSSATTLTTLILAGNELSGVIPTEIASLARLRTLDLGDNNLGPPPTGLFQLPLLRTLSLRNNGFGGSLPDTIGGLAKIRSLDMSGNGLSGSIPESIGALSTLRETLDLSNNALGGTIPSAIGGLSNLERLFLNQNQLTGSVPAALANVSKIVLIRLDDNSLSGIVPDEVCTLYDTTFPVSYIDCEDVIALCFSHCCDSTGVCTCNLDDPSLCLVPSG